MNGDSRLQLAGVLLAQGHQVIIGNIKPGFMRQSFPLFRIRDVLGQKNDSIQLGFINIANDETEEACIQITSDGITRQSDCMKHDFGQKTVTPLFQADLAATSGGAVTNQVNMAIQSSWVEWLAFHLVGKRRIV